MWEPGSVMTLKSDHWVHGWSLLDAKKVLKSLFLNLYFGVTHAATKLREYMLVALWGCSEAK